MTILRKIWNGWKRIAHKIGNFQARLILILFYFIVLAPFALIMKRVDPMKIRKGSSHGWHVRPSDSRATPETMIRQW